MDSPIDRISAIAGINGYADDFVYQSRDGKEHVIPGEPFSVAKGLYIAKEAAKAATVLNFNDNYAEAVRISEEEEKNYSIDISRLGPMPPQEDRELMEEYLEGFGRITPPRGFQSILLQRMVPHFIELLSSLDDNIIRALAVATLSEDEIKTHHKAKDMPKIISEQADWIIFNLTVPSLAVILLAIFRLISIQDFFTILQSNLRATEAETTTENQNPVENEEETQPRKREKKKSESEE